MRFDLSADIAWFKLRSASVSASATETSTVACDASLPLASVHAEGDLPLGSLPFTVSGIPVVANLDLVVGANANLEVGVSSSASETGDATVGCRYSGGHFSFFSNGGVNGDCQSPTLYGQADLKAYVGPEVSTELLDMAGPYAGVEAYGEFKADTRQTPWWKLHAGVDADVGFEAHVFGVARQSGTTRPLLGTG